jgi:circadian clock protein KaiC
VIDSFQALHALAGDEAAFRQFVFQLAGRLTAFPAASLWLSEDTAITSPESAIADAIVELAVVPLGQREKRFLHVRKLRGSGFRSGQHGYRLTAQGLRLFPRLADIAETGDYPIGTHRISTGVPALDGMLGGGLWPGSTTIMAGPTGSGKTVVALHFIFAGAERGERGIIATLQEDPVQLDRMLAALGWPLAQPDVAVMYRSPVDIYIDEWVHDLLQEVERTGARRVIIDSMMNLQLAAADETRFREFLYSLTQRLSRLGVSLLTTYETPDLIAPTQVSQYAISHLADNAITIHYQRDHGVMKRSLAVVKSRASVHDSTVRQFSIGPGGISIAADGPQNGSG